MRGTVEKSQMRTRIFRRPISASLLLQRTLVRKLSYEREHGRGRHFGVRGVGMCCLLLIGAALHPASGEVVAINPSHDATLIEVQPNRTNGGEQWVNAGTTPNATRNR